MKRFFDIEDMTMTTDRRNRPEHDREPAAESPPAVYAVIFVGTTAFIGFISLLTAVSLA